MNEIYKSDSRLDKPKANSTLNLLKKIDDYQLTDAKLNIKEQELEKINEKVVFFF
jgi:hypothetical protein